MASPQPLRSSPPPLVWVTQGKTQHLAHLLLKEQEGKALIRWESTRKVEWVLVQQVAELNLPPRDNRRPRRRRDEELSVEQKPEKKAKDCITRDECLLTPIQLTPTPKGRPTDHNGHNENKDQRRCARQWSIEQANEDDGDDVRSIDTQEDVLLANLVGRKDEPSRIDKPLEHTVNVGTSTPMHSLRPRDDETGYQELNDTKGNVMIDEQEVTNELGIASSEMILESWEETSSDAVVLEFAPTNHLGLCNLVRDTEIGESVQSQVLPTADATTSKRTSRSDFTYKSSAYVQNLAEICYTVMNDRRWRMGNDMKPLFGWEYGDDLNAIIVLSQMYHPLPTSSMQRQCSCLLCGEYKPANHAEDVPSTHSGINDFDDSNGNDDKFRAMHLYSRLFYRKGPWFRINDIYSKYYAPKKTASRNTSDGQGLTQNSKIIDEVSFQEALLNMKHMLSDLFRLCNQGLLRTFHDEEECGKIAGSVGMEGHGVLLSADERRTVLEKLGGSNRKTNTERDLKSVSPRENEIWKQMSQQQSIAHGFLSTCGPKKARHLLPVCPHVNQVVLSKLAMAVVMSASSTEYIPAAMLRAKLLEVKKTITNIADQRKTQALNFSKLNTCYRLREAPLLALRRCCRLFLCATSGPGDMRGDGTNGWKSIRDTVDGVLVNLPIARFVPQPGGSTWNTTVYPGLSSRFGLSHYGFVNGYVDLPLSDVSTIGSADSKMEQVFTGIASFHQWELAVEIRANVDYLLQLNERILYEERRKARQGEGGENNHGGRRRVSFLLGPSDQCERMSKLYVDFLQLLEKPMRRTFIRQFCVSGDAGESWETIVDNVERDIAAVFLNHITDPEEEEADRGPSFFQTDCEKVIFVLIVIITNVFKFCFKRMSPEERMLKSRRCWLRHMWWEGVLAYVLWDCIPVLEKRGLYRVASRALEVLVFGSFQSDSWRQEHPGEGGWGESLVRTPVGDLMISRRARGKAIERLIIDYIHILRQESKIQNTAKERFEESQHKKSKKSNSIGNNPSAADRVNALCTGVIAVAISSAFISFSAIRALARRLKRPLNHLLGVGGGKEAQELGLRMRNDTSDSLDESKRYVDWNPRIDQAVAVALGGSLSCAGSRCSFIGFEDEENEAACATSLNVEQLAMEYYATGRLPVGDEGLAGGKWEGWHDEGGHLRTLFRVLCACPLLGMDGGCGGEGSPSFEREQHTVHLCRYQTAPFDLHVGSWSHVVDGDTIQSVSGFYHRRKQKIEEFLGKLTTLTPQELCDCVHNSIQARVEVAKKLRNSNILLTRDIHQARTLSMLAAGFGGKALAAAFRCLVFDYRHFSGGLPDLLLTRALYSDTNGSKEFVPLGEWVGEMFSHEAKSEKDFENRSKILSDKDDEFLGCSKVGDSCASRSSNRWTRQQKQVDVKPTKSLPELPPRLLLSHNNRPVVVQCLFVEVKSQNDRLDGRQEDWLNVLDRVGNARVCKFLSNKPPKKPEGRPRQKEIAVKSEE